MAFYWLCTLSLSPTSVYENICRLTMQELQQHLKVNVAFIRVMTLNEGHMPKPVGQLIQLFLFTFECCWSSCVVSYPLLAPWK